MLAATYDIWTSKLANKKRKSAPILKVLPHTNFQVSIWWSPLKPDPPSLSPVGGRRSPAVACWASDHWVASSNPLRGKFRH